MNIELQLAGTLLIVFLSTVIGIYFYRKLAINYNIIATKNFRTLHKNDIPKGGGLVFSLISIFTILYLWSCELIPGKTALVIGAGGTIATLFGFIDDILNIPAITKFIVQIILSAFTLIWFLLIPYLSLTDHNLNSIYFFLSPIILIALIWLINLYNFMDGVDAMTASVTIFVSIIIGTTLLVIKNDFANGIILAVIGVSCLGFLLFNWPPARIFMGDAGSVFLGYIFGILIIKTVFDGSISIWTWLIVFGYFFTDTTTTLILRIIHVKKWYGAHRSHAYQNLARVWDNHLKVVIIILLYHFIWLLPLAICSIYFVNYQVLAAIMAITPVIIWTIRYGPLLSSD